MRKQWCTGDKMDGDQKGDEKSMEFMELYRQNTFDAG